jgi:hypothetical protein
MEVPVYNSQNIDKIYLSIFCYVYTEEQNIVFYSRAKSLFHKVKCRNYEAKILLDCLQKGTSRSMLVFLLSKSNRNAETIVDKLLQDGFLE